MSQIHITNLTFHYDGSYDNIFEDVSFQIDSDWKLGFTGRNGRGKTTFMQLLMGKYEYRGNISASVHFDYFPFAVEDKAQLTQTVFDEICSDCQQWEIAKELSLLEVGKDVLDRPFDTLSSGEQTKVLLAALFLKENNFLLIDEPTNHLDQRARKIVGDYLGSKSGFILVSHDRIFLDRCIDHILVINKTNIEVQRGNFSSWQRNKDQQDSFELAENQKLKRDIKKLELAAKRTADWSDKVESSKYGTMNSGMKPPDKGFIGHKSAKMMKRSKAIESRQMSAVEDKSKLLKNIETADKLTLKPLIHYSNPILEVLDLQLYYSDTPVCEPISFNIMTGERIALQGKNGCGKSSILKLLMGEDITYTGSFRLASGLKISYIPQDTSFLKGDLRDYAEACGIDESLFKAILRKLDFSRVQFEKDIASYSEGQKKKVLLARSLCEEAHLYIWDEPLNFIDVISRIQIEELILFSKPTLLFVEHDTAFTENIGTKIIEIG